MKLRSLLLASFLIFNTCDYLAASDNENNTTAPKLRSQQEIFRDVFQISDETENTQLKLTIIFGPNSQTRYSLEKSTAALNLDLSSIAFNTGIPFFILDIIGNETDTQLTPKEFEQIMTQAESLKAGRTALYEKENTLDALLDRIDLAKRIHGFNRHSPGLMPKQDSFQELLFKHISDLRLLQRQSRCRFKLGVLASYIKKAQRNLDVWRIMQQLNSQGVPSKNEPSLTEIPAEACYPALKKEVNKRCEILSGLVFQTGFAEFATDFSARLAEEKGNPLSKEELQLAKSTFSRFNLSSQQEFFGMLAKIIRTYGYFAKYKPDIHISILEICFLDRKTLKELNLTCEEEFKFNETKKRLERAKSLLKNLKAERIAEYSQTLLSSNPKVADMEPIQRAIETMEEKHSANVAIPDPIDNVNENSKGKEEGI